MKFNDVVELKNFYESPQGKLACRLLRNDIAKIWPDVVNETILGYGFALPYLPILSYSNNLIAFMPKEIGVMKVKGSAFSVMVDSTTLPSRNEYFDRVILIHAAENSENLEKLLGEIWRVLKPTGKIILIAPNNDSLWRKFKNPYYKMQGFSKLKLFEYLTASKFSIRRIRRGLFFMPTRFAKLNTITNLLGSVLLRPHGGVYIIEAEKLIFAPGGRAIKIMPSLWDKIFKPKPKAVMQ